MPCHCGSLTLGAPRWSYLRLSWHLPKTASDKACFPGNEAFPWTAVTHQLLQRTMPTVLLQRCVSPWGLWSHHPSLHLLTFGLPPFQEPGTGQEVQGAPSFLCAVLCLFTFSCRLQFPWPRVPLLSFPSPRACFPVSGF